MNPLSSFLERFKKIRDPRKDLYDIADVISIALGFEIKKESVALRSNIVFVKEGTSVKTEMYLYKERILKSLQEKFPHLHIEDVR